MKIVRNMATGLMAGVAVALSGVAANAAVFVDTNVDHSARVVTAADELATSLGTSRTSFSGASTGNWSALTSGLLAGGPLASGDVLLLGQSSDTSRANALSRDAIRDFVTGGGILIQLWGANSSRDWNLLNYVSGENFAWGPGGSFATSDITKTAAAAGTSFDPLPNTLPGASNFGVITNASIGGAQSMFSGSRGVYGAVKGVGLGHVGMLGWDWCCSFTASDRDQWDAALLATAQYTPTTAVPLPAGFALMLTGLGGLVLVARRRRHQVA